MPMCTCNCSVVSWLHEGYNRSNAGMQLAGCVESALICQAEWLWFL
jgi:hypothetical protein